MALTPLLDAELAGKLRDRFPPPGSAAYYCCRFAPPEEREPLLLCFTLEQTLRAIPAECSDPGIALHKLDWWREQLVAATGADSHHPHPLLRAIERLRQRHPFDDAAVQALLDAIEAEIRQTRYPDWARCLDHCERLRGTFLVLTARVRGERGAERLAAVRHIGRFVGLVELLRDAPIDRLRGRTRLPQGAERDGTERAESLYRECLHALPVRPPRTMATALAHLRLYHRLLRRLDRAGFPPLDPPLALTPLRRLVIVWWAEMRAG